MRHVLNEKFVKAAATGGRRSPIFMDQDVIGFGLQVRANGRKAFTLDYTADAFRRRVFIGDYPDWTPSAAREEAKRLKREIDAGIDPLSVRGQRREALTIADLAERYLTEHVVRQAADAQRDIRSVFNRHVLPAWGRRKAADITTSDVDALLSQIAKGRARPHKAKTKKKRAKLLAGARPTPIHANRVGSMLRKMFNLAIRWGVRSDNPATAFIRNPELARERFLAKDEIERLTAELTRDGNARMANVIRLLMLTGARRGEVLNARWDQFDLDLGVWVKPAATTKQRRLHRAPLAQAAVHLLRTIHAGADPACIWVFPGDAPGKPLQEIKRYWCRVRRAAGLQDVRLHDLRHTFASLLVSGGMTLPMIGKLLGHTQTQTTLRYAHLYDDPLRAGLDQVGDMLRPKLGLVAAA
jgi:integrase